MTELEPLTPPECDLRGLEYMPLLGTHLFGSEFNAQANDAEFRVALTLWWKAWTQKPAASLPDDDQALCRLAELGRDMRTWKRVKTVALRGFVKCSDGRLYHRTLAEQALIAWEKRVNERKRKAEWRARKSLEEAGQTTLPLSENQALSENCHAGRDADRDGDRTRTRTGTSPLTGRDGTGRKKKEPSPALNDRISKAEPSSANGSLRATDCFNEVCSAADWSARTDEQRVEALSVVDGWLASGFDLNLDILAGIKQARSRKPEPTRSLKRFTSTIRGKHADRRGARSIDGSQSSEVTKHRSGKLVEQVAGSLRVGSG